MKRIVNIALLYGLISQYSYHHGNEEYLRWNLQRQQIGRLTGGIVYTGADSNGYIYLVVRNTEKKIIAVYHSSDSGTNWVKSKDDSLLGRETIYSFAVPHKGSIFAATSSGIFRSTDRGETWVRAVGTLAGSRTISIAVDSSKNIYVSAHLHNDYELVSSAIFSSTDNGDTWKLWAEYEANVFHSLRIEDIALDSKSNLYAVYLDLITHQIGLGRTDDSKSLKTVKKDFEGPCTIAIDTQDQIFLVILKGSCVLGTMEKIGMTY